MPELIDHGSTGFLVDDVDQAVEAVASSATLDRESIRRRAVARFGRDRMTAEYLAAYQLVLGGDVGRPGRRWPAADRG